MSGCEQGKSEDQKNAGQIRTRNKDIFVGDLFEREKIGGFLKKKQEKEIWVVFF